MNSRSIVRSTFFAVGLFGLMAGQMLVAPQALFAATVTTFSDTLTRIKESTAANHEIKFVAPSAIDAGETLTVTFAGFTTASVDAVVFTDVDFAEGNSGTCSSASFTEKTLAGTASGATWGVDTDGSGVLTITSGTDTTTAARCLRIRIGTNAVSGTTGVNQIVSGTAATAHTVVIGGTSGDSGTSTVDIIADDQVVITATVAAALTFTIDDTAVGFGSLSSSTGRWATADATGTNASGTTPTAANVLTIATNAASGWTLTYNGATLTSGLNTITDAATIDEDSDGTPGTEQFGISASTNGDSTIASGYLRDSAADFDFVPSTTTTLASEAAPTATESISISYLANISGATEAGSYTTTITYIATGNF